MISTAVRHQLIQFVEEAPIEIQEQFEGKVFLGYQIKSLIDPDLFHIAWTHPNLAMGVAHLKKIFMEKLEKDYIAGKPMPFKLKEL